MNKKVLEKHFPIVGIGGSAGGLEASTQLLKALPIDLGMGFVLVQHLDPTHASILADLLSKATAMPVKEARNNTQVESNHVYVIPYNKDMTITKGALRLTNRNKSNKIHMPIDQFFHSLALDQKEHAIAIVLSGTATDGTLGLKSIKSEGGITFAQDETAKYQGMPKAAIASGCVDFIFSPMEIAQELTRMNNPPYIKHSQILQDQQDLHEYEDGLNKILFMLNRGRGIDFRHYKKATVNRRVRRRMLLHKLTTLESYIEYLKVNNNEMDSLHDELLINVTSFFREPKAFRFLHDTIFPLLVKNKSPKTPIRIWVPGCATGEEVYSIAISLSEFLIDRSLKFPVQIFGTDISKTAIEKARSGVYLQNDLVDIPPSYVGSFFEKRDRKFQISKSIRELCIFAIHNVFADPPFSRLDFISCCNLLIYLDSVLQERILQTFHYALKSGGYLRLGKSESIGSSYELFSQVDKKFKLYSKKDTLVRGVVDLGTIISKPEKKDASDTDVTVEEIADSLDIQKEADKILLNHFTPASVVINNDLEIIQFRGSTGTYLEPFPGKATFNLVKMARDSLGLEIRSALAHVRKSGKPFRKENIPIKQNGITRLVSVEILPIKGFQNGPYSQKGFSHYLVLFEDVQLGSQAEIVQRNEKIGNLNRGAKDRRIVDLEQELSQVREDMRSVTEEQEAANEELQTASEEILYSNEELQSINEELETSKEELESTNEELTTVNEELQNRNEQLSEARDYASAIIRTVRMPLLILDNDLRVKTTNRAFLQMFEVTEEETTGKFIYDLGNGQWNIPALRTLLHEILPKDNVFDNFEIEHFFPTIGHKIMLLNGRKFHKDGENILLAIEDISDRKNVEKQKDLFIGIASHELKTPITTMKGYVQILEKRLLQKGDNKDAYLIQNINKQSDRLTSLVNDLLNTSTIQAGKLVLKKKKFDLNTIVTKAVVDFQFTTETHQIIKEGEIKEWVFGDQSRIEQVLSNLITNALKYSPKADKVIVRIGCDKDKAFVSVQDLGFGITKKDQSRIFERFYRTNDKKEMNVAGFGLGLYISAEIIKGHHGKIWVESTKGKGTTFYFTLPLAE